MTFLECKEELISKQPLISGSDPPLFYIQVPPSVVHVEEWCSHVISPKTQKVRYIALTQLPARPLGFTGNDIYGYSLSILGIRCRGHFGIIV